MQVVFGDNSPRSSSSRGSSFRPPSRSPSGAPAPRNPLRDSASSIRTRGWVAQTLDFSESESQDMTRANSGPISYPQIAAPNSFSHEPPAPHSSLSLHHPVLPQRVESETMADGNRHSRWSPSLSAARHRLSPASSGNMPAVFAPTESLPAALQRLGSVRSGHLPATEHSPFRQQSPASIDRIGRAHSGRAPTPNPIPTGPHSSSTHRPYRFIHDTDAPSSGDDSRPRMRRPPTRSQAPTSGLQHAGNESPFRDPTPSAQSRALARPSPQNHPAQAPSQAPTQGQPTELPYAEFIPHIQNRGPARDSPQASRVRGYAFIDDSSGDEVARRPAAAARQLPRQLPVARPTGGWIEESSSLASNVFGPPRTNPNHSPSMIHGDGQAEAAAAAAGGNAAPPPRVTPGMRREREERERQRCRRGNRRAYTFIDNDGSDSDDAGQLQSRLLMTASFSCLLPCMQCSPSGFLVPTGRT